MVQPVAVSNLQKRYSSGPPVLTAVAVHVTQLPAWAGSGTLLRSDNTLGLGGAVTVKLEVAIHVSYGAVEPGLRIYTDTA